jgi:peptidyl-dipeptidase A
MSRAIYEVDSEEFLEDMESLWTDLQPLYGLLHAQVRAKLVSKYGTSEVDPKGPIPMHLLGNLWGQDWEGIYDLVAFPGESIDYQEVLLSNKLGPRGFVTSATNFFASIGFPELPASFEERSYFERPRPNFDCHPSAWLIAPNDYRLKMCIKENWAAFLTVHHEMGHIFHFQSYSHQAILFRDAPNEGISEAIGDAVALSITPEYLQRIGLIEEQKTDANELNELLRVALRKVVRVQFGLMLQKWRWGVMTGEIPPDRYNDAWWELVKEYQGLAPATPRPKEAFDPGAKYHIAADVDYIRYFLADVLTFQIHAALSREAGCKLPIHRCTIYDSKRAGDQLKAALAMGSSRPWGEMLTALTGEETISGKPMRDYLAPLEEQLKRETVRIPIGW